MRTTLLKCLLAAALCSAPAFAEEAAAAVAVAPVAEPTPSIFEFAQDTRGAFLHGTYVVENWGKGIPLQLGVQWSGIRTFKERKYQFTFDAAGAITAVYGGNSSERFYLLGGNLRGLGELGMRLNPERNFSLYAGATLLLNGSAATSLTKPLDQYNPLDGIAGVFGVGALRINGGFSLLDGDKSLLVTVFIGESLRRPGSGVTGPLYTDLGARAQFDIVKSFTATLEGSWGTTFGRADATTGLTNSGTRYEVTASVRKLFGPIWVGIDGTLHGTANSATSSTTTYATSTPTWLSAAATFGVSL